MRSFLLAILLAAVSACESPTAVPATPEEVLKQYQYFVDNNLFEEAMVLSTVAEQQRLAEVSRIIATDLADSTLLNSVFKRMDCETRGDTTLCMCVIEDDYERYDADYILVFQDDRWLVDAPNNELPVDEQFFQDFMQEVESNFGSD